MDFEQLIKSAGFTHRDVQSEFANSVSKSLSLANKVSLLHAETGVGKTLGYLLSTLAVLKENPKSRFIITTSSHSLMKQITEKDIPLLKRLAQEHYNLFPSSSNLMGKSNFVSPERLQLALHGKIISEDERRQLVVLESWTLPIGEYIEQYGDLPLDLTPGQICHNAYTQSEELDNERKVAARANYVITSHAMLTVDIMNGGKVFGDKTHTYLIVDEADILVDQLQQLQQRRLNLKQFANLVEPFVPNRWVDALHDQMIKIEVQVGDRFFCWDEDTSYLARDTINLAMDVANQIDLDENEDIAEFIFQWADERLNSGQVGLGVSHVRKEPSVVSLNPYFSRVFGYYAKEFAASILTSGTLSLVNNDKGFHWVKRELGLKPEYVGEEAMFSPDDFGKMSLTLAGNEYPATFFHPESAAYSKDWLKQVSRDIKELTGNVVVLTASHKESRLLREYLNKISDKTIHLHGPGEKLSLHVGAFKQQGGILITASGHVGLNIRTEDDKLGFDHLVISRIGFPKPDEDTLKALASYLSKEKGNLAETLKYLEAEKFTAGLYAAIRKTRQAFGRGIRAHHDEIHVMITDKRFPLCHELSSRFSSLRNVIPTRFYEDYKQCKVLLGDNEEELVC